MRTTIDIPDDLLAKAIAMSGLKSKRAAVRWALEEALRKRAIEDLLSRREKIDFAVRPEALEAREIKAQYGKRRRRSHR